MRVSRLADDVLFEQEAVIAERDSPLIRRFVVDSIRVCGRIFEQWGQASIDEVTDIVGKVAVLLFGDLQPRLACSAASRCPPCSASAARIAGPDRWTAVIVAIDRVWRFAPIGGGIGGLGVPHRTRRVFAGRVAPPRCRAVRSGGRKRHSRRPAGGSAYGAAR
jgi:hypothetical protein